MFHSHRNLFSWKVSERSKRQNLSNKQISPEQLENENILDQGSVALTLTFGSWFNEVDGAEADSTLGGTAVESSDEPCGMLWCIRSLCGFIVPKLSATTK